MHPLLSKYLIWSPVLLLRGQNIWPLLRYYRNSQYLDRDQLDQEQFAAFRKVVAYAYHNIPFYRNKYREAGVSPDALRVVDDIKRVPFLTKTEVSNADFSHSDYRGLRFRRSTSGSTGMPLVFYKDSISMKHMDAMLYRNYAWYGIDLGFKQARFWGSSLNKIDRIRTGAVDFLLNRVRISPFELEECKYLQFLGAIAKFETQYLYGYAQSIYQFCRYFQTRDIELSWLNLKAVIVTSEMIFASQLRVIKEVLGCEVSQEYGCTEIGLIGFGCPHGSMHLMENLLVESVQLGPECPNQIVASELYGELFPFIRYLVGDRGVISDRKCGCGRSLRILENLSGRKDDFIKCPEGKLVDAYLVEYILTDMPARLGRIHQFKMVQSELASLNLLLIAEGDSLAIRLYLTEKLQQTLGAAMTIKVEFVDALPRELSGKLKFFKSELPELDENGVHNEI